MQVDCDMHASAAASATRPPPCSASSAPPASAAIKRARSPVSSGAYDRPFKRPTLAMPFPQPAGPGPSFGAADDWVARAGGLRIASPLLAVVPSSLARAGAQNPGEEDEDATMADGDVQGAPDGMGAPQEYSAQAQAHHAHSHFLRPPEAQVLYPPPHLHPHQQQQQQDQHQRQHQRQQGQGQGQLQIPAIQIHQATPSPVHPSAPRLFAPPSPQPEPDFQFPEDQGLQGQGLGQGLVGRRQRFTMGPRADCDKCRVGVPGHWAHVA